MTGAMRADAQENQDRILEVAAAAFSRPGADTSLKAIAKEAGVGIGTLYRRFPTREDLVEATYRAETKRLARSASALLAKNPPLFALREWMTLFVTYMLTKQGMADTLPAILADHEGLRAHSRELLHTAVRELRDASVRAGAIRDDVPATDILMALGGITLISSHEQDGELAERLLDLLTSGLHP
ncbi:putative TetR family transcriptional regulator [Rhodococcus opacus]|uniref:Putative TetR family transcriptional regulator n=2 Tax=Rhodococcus opacus TaxID=37919 RepID=A0A1B1K879_RHOOP|nr:putative TetR family transcriptional regulator [Rhodococcus opacus]